MAMKALKVIGGLAVLGAFGYGAYSLGQGTLKIPGIGTAKKQVVIVKPGTEITFVLLETLDAGGSKEGETIDLAVMNDVLVGNAIVITKGTRAHATVTRSRGASLANAVANRPARLEMEFGKLTLADGRKIDLTGMSGEDTYEFTQENTADRIDAASIDKIWQNPKSREALADIVEKIENGEKVDESREDFKKLSQELGLKKTTEIMDEPGKSSKKLSLGTALDAFTRGEVSSLVGMDAVVAAQAMGELTDLVSSVDHKLRGVFKQRTIRATIGTPIQAKTTESFQIEKITIDKEKR